MNTTHPQLAGRRPGTHPAVLGRRAHDLLTVTAIALVPLVLGLAITVSYPKPNPILVGGVVVGVIGVMVLLLSRRYTITLTVLALYLGVFDGPIKLEAATQIASGLRDILIIAIGLGMVLRMVVSSDRVKVPPLSRWVLAFVAFVLVEALNPRTHGLLKSLGGYRQQLEWVPFFFFGYVILRDKRRFRQFFIVLGVIALANGVVGAVQARLSPHQFATWGPGYRELAFGGNHNGISGRTYSVEGQARIRPPALGSDSGFGGGIGALTLPCLLALLAASPLRRRWPILILCIGAVLAIATAASRTSVVVGVVGVAAFAALSLTSGLKLSRPLIGLMATGAVVFGVGSALIAAEGNGIFHRQETLTSVQRASETGGNSKTQTLSEIPNDLIHGPFGYGLGIAGSVSGFGGRQHPEFEGQRITGGSAFSLLMKELGFPGLLIWVGLTINTILLGVTQLRRVRDPELRTYLVGLLAAFIALTVDGLSGPTLAVTIGAFLWFVPGVIAYWLGSPERLTAPAGGAESPASPIRAAVPA